MPNLRSKSSKKRKNEEINDSVDLDSEFTKAAEQISRCYQEKASAFNDMCKLSQVRKAAHDKDVAELAKLKKENKDLKANISKMFAEADAKIEEMKKELIAKIKKDATVAILEARIRMVTEASDKGFDTSLWPVDTWIAKLAKVKGEDPEITVTPASKVQKVAETPSIDLQDQGDTEMDTLASVTEVLQGLATVAEGNTLGEEGK